LIPYKDDNPTGIFPFVTIGIVALNAVLYLWTLFSPTGEQQIVYYYGAIPHNLLTFEKTQPIHPLATVFSSMFLHGGLLHFGGNMLYLWIFGNNIEDRLGHLRFVFFYLAAGVIAAYAHAFTEPASRIPMIGASGAVSGILGAYLLLFPRAHVHTVIILGFFWQVVRVPALIVIGFWAIIQLVNGIMTQGLLGQGGVAWFAHLGGFIFGLISIKLWLPKRRFGRWS
jgi:membrane associated rhomboid family serine protease